MIPLPPDPTPAQAIRDLEAYLQTMRAAAEAAAVFADRVRRAVEEAEATDCGIVMLGEPPDADLIVTRLIPPHTIAHLPKETP